jgi:hypothetical protein
MPRSFMLVIVATWRPGTKNYNGTNDYCPYTNLNGVCPVNFLHVVMYAHNTIGIFKSQLSMLTLNIFFSAFSRILLTVCTVPFS